MKFVVCRCEWDGYYDYRIITSDGSGHIRITFYPNEVYVSDLFVAETHRNIGIATALLDYAETLANGRKITITPIHEWQEEWYNKRGYIIDKEDKV